ncbi:MAG: hypothetical protein IKO41_06950 [Lachnospiraceae bacterium]|nr:hypothetical protein [Lachnospiraceae bacterium]MBR4605950.1 hypothetical protein [Lachnospiraceae bacterium]
MNKAICRELQKLESIKKSISTAQNKSSEMLYCRKIRGYYQYYVGKEYVSKKKNEKRIQMLALKEYREKLNPLLEKAIGHLKVAQKSLERLSEVYEQMHEGKQVLFEPDIIPLSKKIQDFNNVTYEGLPFAESDKSDYHTYRGERVRSKSEKIIADELDRHGIPYHYEMPLLLRVDGQMKEFHPDFTIMNVTTGEVKYLEHLGMMDNPSYYNNVLAKLDIYERNGLLIGRDVILLHESTVRPLNTRIIADYIQEFLV